MRVDSIPLLVFAKEPLAGLAKTRLTTHCSPEQAAEIATILLDQTLAKVCDFWRGQIIVVGAPDIGSSFFNELSQRYDISLCQQGDGDLGARLSRVTQEYKNPFVVIGSDSPHIDLSQLMRTAEILMAGGNAIGPSLDGGYYLLALQQAQSHLFTDISWSSAHVLEQTLGRAAQVGWKLDLLDPLQDVDEWHHLVDAAKHVDALADYLTELQMKVNLPA